MTSQRAALICNVCGHRAYVFADGTVRCLGYASEGHGCTCLSEPGCTPPQRQLLDAFGRLPALVTPGTT